MHIDAYICGAPSQAPKSAMRPSPPSCYICTHIYIAIYIYLYTHTYIQRCKIKRHLSR